jgi:glycine/D-amino acid oxidase-like deaminating enzyme
MTAGAGPYRAAADEADVIIIGAGLFGCNTPWHMHERERKVLVLEAQDEPATKATHAGASFLARWSAVHVPRWDNTESDMQVYGISFYTRLARDCRFDIGFAPGGACYIDSTAQGWERVQAGAARARSYGTRLEVLSAERAASVVSPSISSRPEGFCSTRTLSALSVRKLFANLGGFVQIECEQ